MDENSYQMLRKIPMHEFIKLHIFAIEVIFVIMLFILLADLATFLHSSIALEHKFWVQNKLNKSYRNKMICKYNLKKEIIFFFFHLFLFLVEGKREDEIDCNFLKRSEEEEKIGIGREERSQLGEVSLVSSCLVS